MPAVLGLRAALILLVLIAIAPVFAVVVQASLAEQRARIERSEAGLKALVELGAAHQERLVEGARQMLTAIANAPPVYQDDLAACTAYMRKLQQAYPPAYGTFGLLDAHGRLTCRSSPMANQVSSADRPFFRTAVATGRFSVGEFTVSRASGRQVLTFGLPVYRDGASDGARELRGVAYVAADLAQAGEQLRSIALAPEFTLFFADRDGVVLAAAGPEAPQVGLPVGTPFMRDAIARWDGRSTSIAMSRDAEDRLWALHPVGRPGESRLYVAGLLSTETVLAPSNRRLRTQLGALALITLAAVALAWAFAGHVLLGPVGSLLQQVRSFSGEGRDLASPPPPASIREFAELQRNFHDMARQLVVQSIERDGAMAEMEHQKTLLESVLEGMSEGVLVIDRKGRVVLANGAARRLLPGLGSRAQRHAPVLLDPTEVAFHDLDGQPTRADAWPATRALAGEAVEHFRHRVRGSLAGSAERVFQGSARPIAVPGAEPSAAVIVFSDITDAYDAERALMESELRYRTLFESNPHPMWVFDLETLRFLTVNDAAIAHYGYSREEFLSMTIADIRPKRDQSLLRETLGTLGAGLGSPGVWQHRLKDGRLIHAEVTSHALDYDGRPARMVLSHDITEKVLAQTALSQLNETLERRVEERTRELAASNQELESFSYSVSHDLRAPLQVIDGFSRTLVARHGDLLDPQARHYLARIRENTRRMSQLIDDLLALARVTRAELLVERFDLSAHAKRAVDQLRQQFPERDVRVEIQEPLFCRGDPRMLAIVMENLIGNAWKFTARTQEAAIRVSCTPGEDGEAVYHVADNGAGFDMTYADKLFKAFQRLHAMTDFEGTGIGLATVHRIVSRHGGRVWAKAEPGQGATFSFTLGDANDAGRANA